MTFKTQSAFRGELPKAGEGAHEGIHRDENKPAASQQTLIYSKVASLMALWNLRNARTTRGLRALLDAILSKPSVVEAVIDVTRAVTLAPGTCHRRANLSRRKYGKF
ncbi:hypothetical protein [Caballeronia sp. ATUFL_M2_KS44]|uniref:hypothetical protein n=1 Tax=Caballeronia sp. ATUFL_M2_KS44 TaxID=2921767 RepID=UPI0020296D6C|nr:hypothetical protein [Caballeronia sp. ATUFL_M2_KS44]